MASISLGHFVQQSRLQARIDSMPEIELQASRCLLQGPQRSGKTTLLFQYAFHLALSGQEVVFICDRAKLDQAPPLLPYGVDHTHAAFSKIHFKYVHDLHQLRRYGACLHLLQDPPAAIIVDDLSHLLANTKLLDKRARVTEVTRALAFLADGLDQLRDHHSLNVMLLASDTATDQGSHNMYLLQRWFPLILQVSGSPGGQIMTLHVSPHSKVPIPAAATRALVNYSLTQTYISVEHVQL